MDQPTEKGGKSQPTALHSEFMTPGCRKIIDTLRRRILADHTEFPAELIEDQVISWLDGIYAPEGATQQQLDELDQLTEKWIDDHERGPRQT